MRFVYLLILLLHCRHRLRNKISFCCVCKCAVIIKIKILESLNINLRFLYLVLPFFAMLNYIYLQLYICSSTTLVIFCYFLIQYGSLMYKVSKTGCNIKMFLIYLLMIKTDNIISISL